jgi:hypothetical protein
MTTRHSPLIRAGAAALAVLLPIASVCPSLAGGQAAVAPVAQAQSRPAASPPIKPDARKAKEAYQQGIRAERKQDWQSAHAAYSDAVNWAPENREYQLRREIAKSRLVQEKVDAAERDAISGRPDAARKELVSASYLDPSNTVVRERLAELAAAAPGSVRETREPNLAGQLHVAFQPGTRSFDYRGDTPGAYQEIARQFGVEAAFDVDLVARPVRFRMDNVDFLTATRLLGEMTRTFWRPLTRRLFFVTDDTPPKRREYEPSVLRTVLFPASQTPEQMTELLRLVREVTGITRADLDTRDRTLTLRASPRAIAVAADLIDDLEKPAGELILEIEILEVDRNYERHLGITPPQGAKVFTLNPQQIQQAQLSFEGLVNVISKVFGLPSSLAGLTPGQIAALLATGQLGAGALLPPLLAFGGGRTMFLSTLPSAAANFSRMLSLVRRGRRILLRAEDGRAATFFVGDRIPVSLAAFSPSLAGAGANVPGVSSTSFPTTNFDAGLAPGFVATANLHSTNSVSDLIVANSGDNTISVLPGNGDGSFGTQAALNVGTDPVWIATGKFNSNSSAADFVDVAVANKGSHNLSIFLGDGAGALQAPATLDTGTGTSPVSVVAGDFNQDGKLDLAVANQGNDTIEIFPGNGDGTFQAPALIQLPAGFTPTALAAADFNKDGHLDLAVTGQGANAVWIFLGNGDGAFTTGANLHYATGQSPVWVSSGDFDGDGNRDLAIANRADNTISILLGKGDGTFVPAANPAVPVGKGPASIAVADYNADGRLDLAVADATDNAVSILLNLGGGLFGPNFELPVATAPVSIVTADFNGDTKPDVATANNGSNNVSVILNSTSFSGAANGLAGMPFPGAQYLDIGLKVKATPRMHPNGDVTLQLGFEISSLTSQSFNSIPVIQSETLNQTVRLKPNETGALAGFMESKVSNAITGAPGIAGLPGIGWLGQNQIVQKQDSELLILVTPRLVRLAPRQDHAIYAGHGSLEGSSAAANPGLFPTPQPQPPPPQAPPAPQPTPQPAPPPQP